MDAAPWRLFFRLIVAQAVCTRSEHIPFHQTVSRVLPAGTVNVWVRIESPRVGFREPARADRDPSWLCRLDERVALEGIHPSSLDSKLPLLTPLADTGAVVQMLCTDASSAAFPSGASP